MTNEEALISCDMVCTECQQIKGKKCDKENCANEFKKKAIEKQIPKRICEGRYPQPCCPNCGSLLIARDIHYCYVCGQALDWSE